MRNLLPRAVPVCYYHGMDTQLVDALQTSGLLERFQALPPSHQKEYIQWLSSAKKPETKQKRIAKMITVLRQTA